MLFLMSSTCIMARRSVIHDLLATEGKRRKYGKRVFHSRTPRWGLGVLRDDITIACFPMFSCADRPALQSGQSLRQGRTSLRERAANMHQGESHPARAALEQQLANSQVLPSAQCVGTRCKTGRPGAANVPTSGSDGSENIDLVSHELGKGDAPSMAPPWLPRSPPTPSSLGERPLLP